MKWIDYPSDKCPKCGSEGAEVFTKSRKKHCVNDGEQARCKQCAHEGNVVAEYGKTAYIEWDDYDGYYDFLDYTGYHNIN